MLRPLLRQQMLLGDLELFLVGIAAEGNDLHTVEQGAGDGVGGVGRCDEQDLGEVERDLQKMIAEGAVLLAVKRFEQCGGRVAPVV